MDERPPQLPKAEPSHDGQTVWRFLDLPDLGAKWISLLTAYAILLGILYQWGYWSSFNVPIMQYLGWQDVIRVTFFPLLGLASFLVFSSFLGLGLQTTVTELKSRMAAEVVSRALRMRVNTIVAVITILVIFDQLFAVWNSTHPRIVAIGFLAGFISGYVARYLTQGKRAYFVHVFLMFAIGGVPFQAWLWGAYGADSIINGSSYESATFLDTSRDSLKIDQEIATPVANLGHVNDYDFFWANGKTIIVRSSSMPAFSIEHTQNAIHEYMRLPFRDPMRVPFW